MDESSQNDHFNFLTTGPVGKVILKMAVPTVISMLVTSVYNIVDTFFVGRISTQATAAVGIVFPVMAIIQAFGFYFGQGSGTFISRKLGSREVGEASCMASTSFFSSLVFGLLIMAAGLIFLDPLSRALGSTPTILPSTKAFMRIILFGAPFMTASMTLNNQMRFQGNASFAMYGLVSGAVLNVALVPLFTFTFGLGIEGTAIGTVIGQIFGFLVLLFMTFRGGNIRIRLKDFSAAGWLHFEIFKGGTPSLSRQGLASIATLLLNIAAAAYGDAAIAGMSIVTRISMLIFSTIVGIGQGFQPMCGFSYGAGLYDRVRKGYFFCVKAGLVFLAFCCVAGFIFAENVVDFLRHDPAVVDVGAAAFRWQIITYPFACIITISNMMLQTSGKSVSANILAACRNGIFFIPLILILPHFFGLKGVEMCQAVSDTFSFIVAVFLINYYFRHLGKNPELSR